MNLDKKQKIILTLIIIALAYLAWQIYSMFFANSTTPPTPKTFAPAPTKMITPAQPSVVPAPATTISPTAMTVPATTNTPPPAAPPAVQPLKQATLVAPMTEYQSQYLQLVNRYQLIKMRRLIVDEEAAIASSQAKIAELNQPANASSAAPMPYANANAMAMVPTSDNTYQLMYIDNQNSIWSATLSRNGRFQQVYVGTILPDGTRILRINSNGVVIRRYGKQFLVSFYGNTLLPSSQYVVPPSAAPMSKITTQPWTTDNVKPKYTRRSFPLDTGKKHKPVFAPVIFSTTTNKLNSAIDTAAAPQPAALTPAAMQPMAPLPIKKTPTGEALSPMQPMIAPAIKKTPAQETPAAIQSLTPVPMKKTPEEATPVSNDTIKPLTVLAPPSTEALNLTQEQKSAVNSIENSIAPKVGTQNFSDDEKKLLALPKTHYTLQILGSYKINDLTDIIKTHHLQDAYIFHTYYLNKDWFVLVYGDYATEDEGTNAIKSLPLAVQGLKPWVRAMSSVQDAINLMP